MALEDIEVFAEVVEAKSFTRAGKRLGMPTSTVSSKVARLEERLGVMLMLRTTRQVSITDEGKAYYKYCVCALAELAEAERELAEGAAQPSGILRLTAPADVSQSVLAPIIENYLARYENVSVELIVTNRKVDLVAEGINLAIRMGKMTDSSLIARKFFDTRVGLWASRDYLKRYGTPISAKELTAHKMVLMTLAQNTVKLLENDKRSVNIKFSSRLSADDMQSCKTFIENSAGVGLLPNFIGENESGDNRLVRVLPNIASATTTAYFVYPDQRFVSQNVRTFIDCALEYSQ